MGQGVGRKAADSRAGAEEQVMEGGQRFREELEIIPQER